MTAPAAVPAAVPPPVLPELAGIAEDARPTGIVRTAIFTDPDGAVRCVVLGSVEYEIDGDNGRSPGRV